MAYELTTFKDRLSFFQLKLHNKIRRILNTTAPFRAQGLKFYGCEYKTFKNLYKEIFLFNEYKFQTGSQIPVIIDCGANVGMAAMYFKKHHPQARIISFEANPSAFSILQKNIRENNLQNVETHCLALHDDNTTLSFFTNTNPGTPVGSTNKDRGGDIEIKVPAQRLSDFIKDMPQIDLIKIDIEGAEINVLKDLTETGLLGKATQYLIEYHHGINGEASKLSSFLNVFEEHGFNYNIRATYEDKGDFQDIMIHAYKR